jgi:hypothetical protein
MDPLRVAIALGPLGLYFLLLGAVNLSRRPWLTTGTRDTAALALGISGLMLVGPLELLMPPMLRSHPQWGWMVWIGFYGILMTGWAVLQLPRLTIYNLPVDDLAPILSEVAKELDPDARWAGDSLLLPQLGVHLHVEHFGSLRNTSLVSTGERQSLRGWSELEAALGKALSGRRAPINPLGVPLVTAAVAMSAVAIWTWLDDPQAVTRAFRELLNL